MTDYTMKEAIEAIAGDDEIISVVVGPGSYELARNYSHPGEFENEFPGRPLPPFDTVIPWNEAKDFLDFKWSQEYGGADCRPVIVWTTNKVITVNEYDGSTGMQWVPRNPTNCEITFVGVYSE